jgi:hypothetical protein
MFDAQIEYVTIIYQVEILKMRRRKKFVLGDCVVAFLNLLVSLQTP